MNYQDAKHIYEFISSIRPLVYTVNDPQFYIESNCNGLLAVISVGKYITHLNYKTTKFYPHSGFPPLIDIFRHRQVYEINKFVYGMLTR